MNEFEPQTVWGWLVAADFFFGGTGASLFMVSYVLTVYGSYEDLAQTGLVTGLVFVLVGLAFLLKHQWARRGKLLEIVNRPRTSWISRGAIFNFIFVVFGVLYAAPHWLSLLPWTQESPLGVALGTIGGVAAFLVVIYPGMFLASLSSIPFWNSPIIPLLFISYGLTGALGILSLASLVTTMSSTTTTVESLVQWQMLLLGCSIVLVASQLAWAFYSKRESRMSVVELTKGKLFGFFVVGSLVIGLFVPLVATAFSYFTGDLVVSALSGGLILIGSVLHKYTVLAAGGYVELMPPAWPPPTGP